MGSVVTWKGHLARVIDVQKGYLFGPKFTLRFHNVAMRERTVPRSKCRDAPYLKHAKILKENITANKCRQQIKKLENDVGGLFRQVFKLLNGCPKFSRLGCQLQATSGSWE